MNSILFFVCWIPSPFSVGVFVSHGGYSSLQEAARSRTPVLVIPQFGDQPDNADAVWASGTGRVASKSDDELAISRALTSILRDRETYVGRLKNVSDWDTLVSGTGSLNKAAQLIELMADGGVDNILQRTVSLAWAHYAAAEGPSFWTASSFWGATLWLSGVFGVLVVAMYLALWPTRARTM